MSNFDLLHPALKHHIANSLGWRELRPFQESVIPHLLAGEHGIILAPTAGGKTEAALFPVMTRVLEEDWAATSVLYICPIRALLNNLETRLQRYCSLVGRRAAMWHGDVKAGERQRILREPPDCLLTTPESLELMLVSKKVDAQAFFANLRAIVVDEVHAFAGDDRGWHLLSVLERVVRLAGREIQRIGLSATVGNPEELLAWLAGPCQGERFVYRPAGAPTAQAEVKLDYVGSLGNAAVVISRLHRGEKRLVFVDSRARAELLGMELKQLGTTTFVTHSSLSHEQRQAAEEAFASREDCVIVATSVLELGVDVGDLDRVIQIDSPATVSSFLQRMGRTGRRGGARRNCLLLATTDEALLQAAGVIRLWAEGFVEDVVPPARPLHIFAQQLMALALQEGGIGRNDWSAWIGRVPAFASLPTGEVQSVLEWMLSRGIFFDEAGILWFGPEGDRIFSRRNYMDLLSVFTSPPLFRVLQGRRDLGFVDEMSFLTKQGDARVLLLGGRSWQVTHIDWARRTAHVIAVEADGRSRWRGQGASLSYRVAQAIRDTLIARDQPPCWSNRATTALARIRTCFGWLDGYSTHLLTTKKGNVTWWTFAGSRANATLAGGLSAAGLEGVTHDSLTVSVGDTSSALDHGHLLETISTLDSSSMLPMVDQEAIEGLKFVQCLPPATALGVLQERLRDAGVAGLICRTPRSEISID